MKTTTIIIAAVLLGDGYYLYTEHKKTAAQGPTLEDQANKALASETSPYALKALAEKVRAAGFGTLADLLEAKASAILAFQSQTTKVAIIDQSTAVDQHPASAVAQLGAAVMSTPVLTLHQALAQGGGIGGGLLDPMTGNL